MDNEIKKQVYEAVELLRKVSPGDIDFDNLDPIARMLLVALINEGQKLHDEIADTPRKVVERFCSDFIPYDKVSATPAITVVNPRFRTPAFRETITVDNGVSFQFKKKESKLQLNYLPLLRTLLLPHSNMYLLSHSMLKDNEGTMPLHTGYPSRVWLGLQTEVEIESLRGLSIMVRGTGGIRPEHLYIVAENRNAEVRELEISAMGEMENIGFLEPFDAQQSSNIFFAILSKWKDYLQNLDDTAIFYITDDVADRDLFKPHAFPKCFQQWLEDEILDGFRSDTIWLRLDFPEGYSVPDTIEVTVNVVPVVNVDLGNVILTQGNPIAKLQKNDNSYFLQVVETSTSSHKQGFDMASDEVSVRDFEASRYNNGDLYRDVRTLYNRFLDDYYAFIEYNGLKDGEMLRRLREIINKLGKSVGEVNNKYRFDSGTYVMRHISQEHQTASIRVNFMTTMGRLGNLPHNGDEMETRRMPGINQKVPVMIDAVGGTDKASVDARYELLRFYTLTNDRLYTKMDVDAFLRKEIMLTFGKEEYNRISPKIHIEGAAGATQLRRGLYIDIEFRDRKNYDEAVKLNFDLMLKRRISALSCISMPIIVSLINLEG
ncbi:MAG: hypothetical protein K2M05_07895 [Paramuribaculum sp.]|nr:hypothetical protein [Paramuribaculum sp.]